MNQIALLDFVHIGTTIRFLQDVNANSEVHGKGWIIENIDKFFIQIEKLKLKVTKKYSEDLNEFQHRLIEQPNKKNLTLDEVKKLKDLMNAIRKVFESEMDDVTGYVPTDKKIELKKLLNEIGKIFSPTIYDQLSAVAQYDFNEGGICIAFERPTAAAFHILRGTEAVLKSFYKFYFRTTPDNKTWGQMLHDLKNKNAGRKPSPVTLNHLVNIKDSFRNPTQHPEKIYDIYEVQDLLNLCADVVNRMIAESQKSKKK